MMRSVSRRLSVLVGAAVLGTTLLVPSAAYAAPSFRFVPVDLYCSVTEDDHGPDGAYIRADARVYWPYNGVAYMNNGSRHDFAARYALVFEKDIKLDLYDQDRGIWDDDDHLGTVWVRSTDADPGDDLDPNTPQREIFAAFMSDGARYTMTYYVERI